MSIIDKAYDVNKKIFHRNFFVLGFGSAELHHIFGRVGIAKCCLRLFARATFNHSDDYKWVKKLRIERKEDYEKAKNNFLKQLGCKEKIFKECNYCYFFKEVK